MILVIDNYDSFTYNIVQQLGEFGAELCVYRNDQITVDAVKDMNPSHIVISPGPGDPPDDVGISIDVIRELGESTPILGVCLGHQTIGYTFGGKVIRADKLMHGKTSMVTHYGDLLFKDVPETFQATRYHSLILEKESFPDALEVTARTQDGIIMGLRHKDYPIVGVQFHPESILTPQGPQMLKNFIENVLIPA